MEQLRHCSGCHENFGMGRSIHNNFELTNNKYVCGLPATSCVKHSICPVCGNQRDATIMDLKVCPYCKRGTYPE